RERLDALYGSSARLELRRVDPRETEAVLDLPLESSAGADERGGAPGAGGAQ
ncbi:MAG: hypothetical protein IAE86_05035, partial [Burkholderiaceae bacterium]|nr:hypothetical protein [Burkholderiaceae bacterium]